MMAMMPSARLLDDASGNRNANQHQQNKLKNFTHNMLLVTIVGAIAIAAVFPTAVALPSPLLPPPVLLAPRAAEVAAPVYRLDRRLAADWSSGLCGRSGTDAAEKGQG